MSDDRRRLSKRSFLALLGATGTMGCLQGNTANGSNEDVAGEIEGGDGSETDEPGEENEEDEVPTLFVDEDSRATQRDSGRSLHDFEALSEWEVIAGTLEHSHDVVYTGTRSACLAADGDSGTTVRLPLDGIDLSETTLSCAVYVDTPGTSASPLFDIDAPDLNRRLYCRARHRIDEPGWVRYDLGVPRASTLGSIDGASLTINWDGPDVEWYLDDLRAVPVTEEPRLVVQFDDSLASVYDNAFPIMEEYDIQATMFTVTGRIGNGGSLSLEEMREMQEAGWEFGSHTASHPRLAELEPEKQREEIEGAKQWLLDHEFYGGADLFAFPFGSFTPETLDIVSDYHTLATCGRWGGVVNRNLTAPLALNRYPADDVKRAKHLIDLLQDGTIPGDTLVLYYHGVVEDDDQWIDPVGFEETMAYVDRQGVETILTSDLWEAQSSLD